MMRTCTSDGRRVERYSSETHALRNGQGRNAIVTDLLSSVLHSAGRSSLRPRMRIPRGALRPPVARISARLALAVLLVTLAAAAVPGAAAASDPATPLA